MATLTAVPGAGPTGTQEIDVWPAGVPASGEWAHDAPECERARGEAGWTVWNVSRPTLTPYLPDRTLATGTGIVVCPGGGFEFLVMGKEGVEVARWLNARGIAAFILKYRLLPMPVDHDAFRAEVTKRREPGAYQEQIRAERARFNALSIEDGRQALHLVRERAAEWGVDPERLGIMGFSAGGTVVGGTALGGDAGSRPSFAVPVYGAPPVTAPVPGGAPPLFIVVANDDARAAANCVALYSAWRAAGRSVELHVYARGGHGFGLKQQGTTSDRWIEQLGDWLSTEGFLP